MKKWVRLVRDVLNPDTPRHMQHLVNLDKQERRLTHCLQLLDAHATRTIKASTDEAAEF